jgi:hypothetical protein
MTGTASTIEALVEDEIGRIEQPELVALARKLRIPARLEDVPWDYGNEGQTYPCWIVLEHLPSNTAVAYCSQGFGPSYPWGLLSISEPRSMGMDSQWFVSLEDALRASPAWDGENPNGYEVR